MCVAIPRKVLRIKDEWSVEVESSGRVEVVDVRLLGNVEPGDWVLVFRQDAVRIVDEDEAKSILEALSALSSVMAGGADESVIEAGFSDLVGREPQLPDHLKALVGKKME